MKTPGDHITGGDGQDDRLVDVKQKAEQGGGGRWSRHRPKTEQQEEEQEES